MEWFLPDKGGLSISVIADFHTQQSLEFAKNGAKTKNIPVRSSSMGINALLMRAVRRSTALINREGPDWSKLTEKCDGNTNDNALQQWYAEESLNTQRIKPLSG